MFAAVLALGLRFALEPVLDDRAPFIMFWFTIIMASLIGGIGPGLFATLLSTALALIFFLPPWSLMVTTQTAQLVGFSLFIIQGIVLSILTGKLRIARQQSEVELAKRSWAEQHLRVQYDLSRTIVEAQSFEMVIPRMLETITNGLQWQLGQWWELDRRTNTLSYTTSYATKVLAAADVRAFEMANRQTDVTSGVGLLGETWQHGTTTWLCPTTGANTSYETGLKALGMANACALPIHGHDGLIGMMVFMGIAERDADDALLHTLGTLSSQIGQFYERYQAGANASASEARKSAMLSAALDAIITIDHHSTIQEWNPSAAAMFGYSAEHAIGTNMSDLIVPPAMRASHRKGMAHYLATGDGPLIGKSVQMDAYHASGRTFPIEMNIIRLPTEGPAVFTGYIRDLTQHKQAEAAVHFQAQLLDSVEEAVVATDTEGMITYWNRFAQTLYGWSASEAIGCQVLDLIIPPRSRSRSEAIIHSMRSGESWSGEWRMQRRSGTTFPAILTNAPVYYQHGELVGYIGISRDITERKRAEDASRFLAKASVMLSSSLQEAAIVEQLTKLAVPRLGEWCALDMLQPNGSIRRVALAHADRVKQALSLEMEQRYGTDLNEAEGPARVLREGRSILYRDLTNVSMQKIARDPDHLAMLQRLALSSIISVPLIARGRTLGAVSIANSNARRRFDEDDLRLFEDLALRAALAIDNARLHEETQAAVRLRDEFLSVAAHELRTPVTSVLAYSQVLTMRTATNTALDARTQRAIQTIESQSQRLSRLINSLLDVSRLSSGHFQIDTEALDLCELVHRIVAETGPTLDMHTLHLQCPIDPVIVHGDPQRLEQMLLNLLQNAVKYSPLGGEIRLNLAQDDHQARISIADQGVGIPQSALPHIFHRFFRAANSAQADTAGMGIGLYVVHEIVTRHGGTITVSSEEGQGTTFTASLPLTASTVLVEQ